MASYWTLEPITFIDNDGNVKSVTAHRVVALTSTQATALAGSVIRIPLEIGSAPGPSGIDPAILAQINAATANITALQSGKQAVDADLTAIANLAPANDDLIQRKGGAWTNRTLRQVKADLSLGTLSAITPVGTPDGTKFLRDDGTWATPAGGGGGISVVDNGDGTATISGSSVTDNGDGTATITY